MLQAEDNNLETFRLVWLHTTKSIPLNERLVIESQLRAIINHVRIFTDIYACRKYLENSTNNDRIVIIVDSSSNQEMISYLHKLRQVTSIYIYNNTNHFKTLNICDYGSKIKNVHTNFDNIRMQLELDYQDAHRRRYHEVNEPMAVAIFNTISTTDRSSTLLNGQFMLSHLIIDVLLRIPSNDGGKQEFIAVCKREYHGNCTRLQTLNEFEQSYSCTQALLWYTKNSFLYQLLNKALRLQDINMLVLLRFFIHDIYQQLKQLQSSSQTRLYRGQLMSTDELDLLKKSIGQLISMNSFLSTTINRSLALFFLGVPTMSDTLQQVLFEIDAEPQLNNVRPFANITAYSYFSDEEETLMMPGSIFRLESVSVEQEENGAIVHVVRLTLCSDAEDYTKPIYEAILKEHGIESTGTTSVLDFGHILVVMGKFNEAEKYFHRLLIQLPMDQLEMSYCYYGLGKVASDQGAYETSRQWFRKALDIRMKNSPIDHDFIGNIHNFIGISFVIEDEHELAFESFNKAQIEWKQVREDNPRLALYLNNMGVVCQKEKRYNESLDYQKKSLSIYEANLPAEHPCIAVSIHNIGEIYFTLEQYETALEHYERALKMLRKSLPEDHTFIACSLGHIGQLYEKTNEIENALDYLQKSIHIYREIVPADNQARVKVEESIQRLLRCKKQ